MIECQKTGAVVWILPYMVAARGDAYSESGLLVLRLNNESIHRVKPDEIHYVVFNADTWFDKEDQGRTSTLITTEFSYLGYEGSHYP